MDETTDFKLFTENTSDKSKVVVFEDTDFLLRYYVRKLRLNPHFHVVDSKPVGGVDDAIKLFLRESPQIVITDLSMPNNLEGFDVLKAIKGIDPKVIVILSTCIYSPYNTDPLTIQMRQQGFDAIFHKLDLVHIIDFLERKANELTH